jgi:hypothetical protein
VGKEGSASMMHFHVDAIPLFAGVQQVICVRCLFVYFCGYIFHTIITVSNVHFNNHKKNTPSEPQKLLMNIAQGISDEANLAHPFPVLACLTVFINLMLPLQNVVRGNHLSPNIAKSGGGKTTLLSKFRNAVSSLCTLDENVGMRKLMMLRCRHNLSCWWNGIQLHY